jgi:poly(A) polymerase
MEATIITRDQHPVSRKQIDPDSLKVLYRLHRNGHKAYLVGGSVRDLLLGRRPKDFDIGTDATPEQVRKLFRNGFLVGRRFRLAHIRFAGNKVIEVATFRRHPRQDELPENPDEHFHFVQNVFGNPGEDAFRRDFTINALFYNIHDFSIIDYVGGLEDLEAKRLRVIGDPLVRFVEDPVRMLRAVEFAARLDFTMDAEIYDAIEHHKALLAMAAPARVREEIMELFRHQIAGPVLKQCRELGMLPHLLAGYPGHDESIELLKEVDRRTASGAQVQEGFAIAALYLRLFMDRCPPTPNTNISEALQIANEIIDPHCRYFSVASGIRHEARELLLGCFRLARGRGLRGERRFLSHPFTPKVMALFKLWSEVRPELNDLVEAWTCEIASDQPAKRKKRRRPRRQPRKKTDPENP